MRSGTIWTVLGAIAALVIAWLLVNVLFHVMWFIAKLVVVVIVAAIVFFALRAIFARRRE